MANIINFELCAEDRARLDRIAQALENLTKQGLACYVDPTKAPEAEPVKAAEPKAEDHPVEDPFQALPAGIPVPWDEPAKEEPKVDRADIQRKVVELSGAGKKAQVRDIVKAYADKVSGIPEDKLAEVWTKLTGLES